MQPQAFADSFAVPIDYMSPDYQLEHNALQSSDATRVAFWDKTLLVFNKSILQCHLSIWGTICLFMHTCLKAPLEAQQKQHTESTGRTVLWLRLLSAMSKVLKAAVEQMDDTQSAIAFCCSNYKVFSE